MCGYRRSRRSSRDWAQRMTDGVDRAMAEMDRGLKRGMDELDRSLNAMDDEILGGRDHRRAERRRRREEVREDIRAARAARRAERWGEGDDACGQGARGHRDWGCGAAPGWLAYWWVVFPLVFGGKALIENVGGWGHVADGAGQAFTGLLQFTIAGPIADLFASALDIAFMTAFGLLAAAAAVSGAAAWVGLRASAPQGRRAPSDWERTDWDEAERRAG